MLQMDQKEAVDLLDTVWDIFVIVIGKEALLKSLDLPKSIRVGVFLRQRILKLPQDNVSHIRCNIWMWFVWLSSV